MKYALILIMMGFWNPEHIEKQQLATFASRDECEVHLKDVPMCRWTNKSCVCSEVKQ